VSNYLPVTSWYDDLCSCLQVDVACVLRFHGWDPVRALGASWRFTFVPGTCEPVEFYFPCDDEDLAGALAAGQPLHAVWRWPSDASDAAEQLRAAIDAGRPPIVAVDNYHLPFRPAYHDVHAAHLVVVRGYDGNTVQVLDPMPPAFDGSLADSVLATSRAAATVTDRTDPFFAGSNLRRRWLEVYPTGPQPVWSWDWVEKTLRDNLSALTGPASAGSGRLTGLAGFAAYIEELPDRARAEGPKLRQELYVLGWWTQAAAALHGEFLCAAGKALHRPDLVEAGRIADRVAHEWTGLRITAAHGGDRELLPGRLLSRGRRVLRAWEEAVDEIGDTLGAAA
jgi:hypothetical protein